MFFGKIISHSQPFQFNEENVDENAGEVLMLTNVVLAPQSKVILSLHPGLCIPLFQKGQ